jgi:hypothetical protein
MLYFSYGTIIPSNIVQPVRLILIIVSCSHTTYGMYCTFLCSIDPGFGHGCKVAAVSERGEVLDTALIYPRFTLVIPFSLSLANVAISTDFGSRHSARSYSRLCCVTVHL